VAARLPNNFISFSSAHPDASNMTTTAQTSPAYPAYSLAFRAARACGVIAALTLSVLPAVSHAIEEPTYTTVRSFDDIELRDYAAYTVAEVLVKAEASDAGNRAFPILAGYIFGKNKGERTFAMTAPVTQTAAPVKMEMTAPVTQTAAEGGFVVQFVLPKGITVANAPEPLDARVMLREVAPQRVAVIRYSGFWSQSNYDEHLAKLQSGLRAAGIAWTGEPIYSRYDGPMTPWFLRRNEIWLQLAM
jgi:SOUL heme-binding protein